MKQLTMTKVLTPLAALAFAFGVQAAAVSTDGFESYSAGSSVTNATGWSFTAGTDGAEDASAVTAYDNNAPSVFPDGTTAGSNYLKLSTEDGMLFRNMDGANGETVQLGAGLYVDTDVQFTITDPSDRPEVTGGENGDKFIIWLEANGADTNLCAWAGYYDASGNLSSNVYSLVDSADSDKVTIEPNSWHRLTVKAIANVNAGGTALPGFQVYVDGHLFATTAFAVDSAYEATLAQAAQDLIDAKTFLPSMTAMASLTKVGFSGEGALDNVVVTKEVPGFMNPATLTFEWESDAITSVTLTDLNLTLTEPGSVRVDPSAATLAVAIAGTNLDNYNWTIDGVAIANPANFTIVPSTKTYTIAATAKDTVAVTFTLDSSWNDYLADISAVMIGDLDVTADIAFGATVNLKVNTNVTVTVTSNPTAALTLTTSSGNLTVNGASVTVDAFASAAAVSIVRATTAATVNGQPYGSFADALAAASAAGTATIALAADATVGDAAIAAGKDVTIDLAGNDITGAANAAAVFTVADGGTLTITNSTSDVGIVSKGDATACISNAGTLNLQAGKFDIAANGAISGGTINVTGGAFNAATFAGATLPEGKILVQDTGAADTYAYVLGDAPVAQIVGGATYTTLNAAFEAAGADDTVMVLSNITAPALGTLAANRSTILDLNGKKITTSGGGYWVTVPAGSTLVITDSTEQATGEIELSTSGNTLVKVDGTFTLAAGTVDLVTVNPNNTASAFNVKDGGTGYMNGGTVLGRIAAGQTNATLVVNGGTIGIVQSKNRGDVTINGGTITTIEKVGTSENANIVIPGLSTAQFGADYSDYCESGYETTLSGDWYVVTKKQETPAYPTYVGDDATLKSQYDTWKATYGDDTGSAYESAFLLNVAPAGDTTLDATAVTISGTTVTITIDHATVNGYPYVKTAATLEGLKDATPVAATVGEGGVITLPNQSGAAAFYKVGVSATPIQ